VLVKDYGFDSVQVDNIELTVTGPFLAAERARITMTVRIENARAELAAAHMGKLIATVFGGAETANNAQVNTIPEARADDKAVARRALRRAEEIQRKMDAEGYRTTTDLAAFKAAQGLE